MNAQAPSFQHLLVVLIIQGLLDARQLLESRVERTVAFQAYGFGRLALAGLGDSESQIITWTECDSEFDHPL